jgi:hypothetical protein
MAAATATNPDRRSVPIDITNTPKRTGSCGRIAVSLANATDKE